MLLQHEIHLEDFGGDVQSVCISALKVYSSHSKWKSKIKAHLSDSVQPRMRNRGVDYFAVLTYLGELL